MESRFVYVEPAARFIDLADPIDRIAMVAHNCYKVAPKDHESNLAFVGRLIKNEHLAMVEHYIFHAACSAFALDDFRCFNNPFITYDVYQGRLFASFSLRVILENAAATDPHARKVISTLVKSLPAELVGLIPTSGSMASPYDPEPLTDAELATLPRKISEKHLAASYLLTTDRGVTHELVRHRLCSFAQESTRYCNYSKDKFENRISIIRPLDYDEPGRAALYDAAFQAAGTSYFALLAAGAQPQQARAVLPTALKADLCITASLREWKHIFELRLAKAAHPECRRVLLMVAEDMRARGLMRNIPHLDEE